MAAYELEDRRLPFWTKAPKDAECNHCERPIAKGENMLYYPSVEGTWCVECGPIVKPVELEE